MANNKNHFRQEYYMQIFCISQGKPESHQASHFSILLMITAS